MRIALVGVENRIHEILALTRQITLPIDITPYPYANYRDVGKLVQNLEGAEGILFSGFFPYSIAVDTLDDSIPVAYLEFNETSLIKLILSPDFSVPPPAVSVDSLPRPTVVHTYRELQQPLEEMYLLARDKSLTVEKVIAFHQRNATNAPNVQIVSGWYSAHQAMRDAGYPSHLLMHTYFSVMGGLNRIINAVNFKNSKGGHPAVCIVRIDDLDRVRKSAGNELKMQKLLYRLKSFLLDFQEKLLSFTFADASNRFSFSTTRRLIEHYTDHYRDFPLLYEIYAKFNLTVSVGVGFGLNPMTAYAHAQEALALAAEHGNTARILTDGGRVITPVADEGPVYQQKNFTATTLEIAGKSGVGPTSISKIEGILAQRGSNHLSAYDLAKALGVTMRSGTRLMARLQQAGYAVESGVEQPPRGRPRKVYQLNL